MRITLAVPFMPKVPSPGSFSSVTSTFSASPGRTKLP